MNPLRFLLPVIVSIPAALAAPDPIDDATARRELARVLRDDGQTAAAVAEYRKLLTVTPTDPTASVELAEVLLWQKQPAEAARILATIPADKLGVAGRRVLGAIAVEQGRFAEAETQFAAALALDPRDARTRFDYAQVLTWQKKYPAALGEYRRLLELRPKDVQLRRHYAQVLGWSGDKTAAAEQWRLTLEPATP